MSLSASTTWEVRTTGSDSSGGGFVTGASGTDYSQQDAAQFSGTDLAVDATTNTKVTSASHNFAATDVGNIIQVTAGTGWTTGFYQIVSVASNAATLDRSPAATSTTGGTWAEGGAMASPGKAAGAKVAGNDVWIKGGTYTLTTSTTNVAGGPVADAVGGVTWNDVGGWYGYASTRGDRGTPPVISAGARTSVTVFTLSGSNGEVDNVKVDGNSGASNIGFAIGGTINTISRCVAVNCPGTGINHTSDRGKIFLCRAASCGTGIKINADPCVVGCVSSGNTSHGFVATNGSSASAAFVDCIAYANGGSGFSEVSNCSVYVSCTSYGNTADGFGGAASFGGMLVNCLAVGNGGYGYNAGSASFAINQLVNCAGGFPNTSGNAAAVYTNRSTGFVTLTGDPFTNAAGGDFSLNNTAGAGAACRAAGIPGAFPGGTTTGYPDIGAAQHQDAGGTTNISITNVQPIQMGRLRAVGI